MERGYSTIKASILVFLASGCSMVLELVAGRILAPYIGVSLYTWTSIIGVVLAGIAIGNYLGGKVGDRHGSPLLLTGIFFAASLTSLAILPETILLNTKPLPYSFHLMTKSTLYTLMLFFLPTCVLGMVTPVVIKLNLANLKKTGSTVGTVYAVSTFGAILGTFATGFLLISWFGTRNILWGVAAVLLITGIIASAPWKKVAGWSLTLFMIALYLLALSWHHAYNAPGIKESNYYSINVVDTKLQGRNVKYLSLDHLIHSYVDLEDPTFHGYDYEKIFAQIAAYRLWDRPDAGVLFIGGGGYSFSRYMEIAYPASTLEVVEIDPAVTEVAYSHLGLPAATRIKTVNSDARIFFLERGGDARYDLVVGDAFNDMTVPYHLTTYEFNEHVKRNMAPGGIYMANIIDDITKGQFLSSLMYTLSESFEHIYLYIAEASLGSRGPGTFVIIASDQEIDADRYKSVLQTAEMEIVPGVMMQLEDLPPHFLQKPVFLTDDYVPVDNMLAPLFTR